MPGRICCENGHGKSMKLQDAATAISEQRPLGVCQRCGKTFRYIIEHTYANDATRVQYRFEVVRVVRLISRFEDEGFDPFLLVLKNLATQSQEESILPIFWAPGRAGRSLGGQFPPLLTVSEWRRLFSGACPDIFR